jgi:hypothetical protein
MRSVAELLPDLAYDVCAMTGDYDAADVGLFDRDRGLGPRL